MKIKYKDLEADVKAEELAKQIIDNKEKDWKEKLESKTIAKKEILELKHKNKIEEKLIKKMNKKDLKLYYKKKDKYSNLEKQKKIFKILSIIMFFIYGLFFVLGFQNQRIIAAIISLIQMLLTIISYLISIEIFQIFKNDYKILLMISFSLIIFWLMFAV